MAVVVLTPNTLRLPNSLITALSIGARGAPVERRDGRALAPAALVHGQPGPVERRPGHAARLNGPLRGRSFISPARYFISEARSFTALLQLGEHVAGHGDR